MVTSGTRRGSTRPVPLYVKDQDGAGGSTEITGEQGLLGVADTASDGHRGLLGTCRVRLLDLGSVYVGQTLVKIHRANLYILECVGSIHPLKKKERKPGEKGVPIREENS